MAAIRLERVTKSFGTVHVIKGVDLEIEGGEFVVFVGPSGCGKSTLLRLVAGLEDVSSGTIWIEGVDVTEREPAERGVAMVFQSYALYPHMSVYENMAFGLKLAKTDPTAVEGRVRHAARILQIEHLLDRKPRQLSGGQRQRVAIGRAIVREPKVFLFDEPLSNLDAALRVQMRVEIAKLHHSMSATMIYVTHDQVEAMTMADRIVVLDAGIVQQFASPLDLYHHPKNRFVAGFIGSPRMNFLPCTVQAEGGGARVTLPGGVGLRVPQAVKGSAGEGWTLGVRPEHLLEGGGGDAALTGEVVTVERLGGESYVYVDIGQPEPLVVKAAGTARAHTDEHLPVGVPAGACYLFTPDGLCLERASFG